MLNKLILPVFAVAAAFAQPPSGAPAFTEIKAYLNLSDTQVTSITTANRTAMEANRTAAAQMRTKHEALQAALNSGSTDAAAIGRAMLDIQALRKQLEANHAKVREQALSFLTADQKTKLKVLEEAEKLREEIREAHALQLLAPPANAAGMGAGRRGAGGPGGPGGPGRFGGGPAGFRQ